MTTLRERYPAPIVHVMALALLTAVTNASAISPDLFGGRMLTIPLAAATLLTAGLEHVVRRWWMLHGPLPARPDGIRDVLRVHTWGCGLAALVSFACAVSTIWR